MLKIALHNTTNVSFGMMLVRFDCVADLTSTTITKQHAFRVQKSE